MESIDLNSIPLSALNYSSRYMIGKFLNAEQNFLSKEGYARDYRGLAEQMDFMYNDIRNFQRNEEPTLKVLEAWESDPSATIGKLIQFLENMGRHDAIQDLQPRFEKDAKIFVKKLEYNQKSALQVPEVTSCRGGELSYVSDSNILTREDTYTGECTLYDAYLSYADEDFNFASYLVKCLEADGFKIFLRHRDMLGGHFEYEANMQIIKERCKRVLVLLSQDFLKCPSCEVQANFAAGLGFDERCRKIIPILWKPCQIPLILKFLSKIDFTKPGVQDWIWEKLKSSLRDVSTSVFISSEKRLPQESILPQLESSVPDTSNPAIVFPPSSSCSFYSDAPSTTCISSEAVLQSCTQIDSVSNVLKSASPPKQKNKLFFWQNKKVSKKHDLSCEHSTSTSVSSSSNATSGFHSQSASAFSTDISN